MYRILFKWDGVTIYSYGFFVFLGVMVSYLSALREAKQQKLDVKVFSDIIFWCFIMGLVGARFLFLCVEYERFLQSPLAMIFSRSGFVFYGGLISGLLGLYFLTRRYKQNFFKLADTIALVIPLGHSLGRIGCFFNGCCYGKPTTSWLGVKFPPDSPAGILGEKVIPTQLISSFFLIVIFFMLRFIKKKKEFNGEVFLSYLILYGIFRFIIEFFRGDPRGHIFIFSVSQAISLAVVGGSIFLWQKVKRVKVFPSQV